MIAVRLNEVRAQQVGKADLIKSLVRLTKLAAESDTGGARIAAHVVLSAYNSADYPLDVAQLGGFDERHFQAALDVISLRYQGFEPHEFFVDGDRLFNEIGRQWVPGRDPKDQ